MNRPHGLDELAGVTAVSTVPLILLPVPTVRDLTAYTLDLERRVALVDAVADLLLAMHPLDFLNRMEIGRLVGCVRALREASADPVPDFSVARDVRRGGGG